MDQPDMVLLLLAKVVEGDHRDRCHLTMLISYRKLDETAKLLLTQESQNFVSIYAFILDHSSHMERLIYYSISAFDDGSRFAKQFLPLLAYTHFPSLCFYGLFHCMLRQFIGSTTS
jgi:hypothetical protein